ncbi:unnamed protein product [Auanema sp. JU1783]|nr:unnamed protein product [Auanema sp. JU1783]
MNLSPLMNLLTPESMGRFAEIAQELSSMAANNLAQNEKDTLKNSEAPKPVDPQNARPSEVLGQAMSSLTSQSRNAFIDALNPVLQKTTESTVKETTATTSIPEVSTTKKQKIPPRPEGKRNRKNAGKGANAQGKPDTQAKKEEIRHAPVSPVKVADSSDIIAAASKTDEIVSSSTNMNSGGAAENPLLKLASQFLRAGSGANGQKGELPQIGLKDFLPGVKDNFGIPRGQGCFPFLSEFMQAAYGNCQQVADEGAWDAWGNELKNAILTGEIDFMRASQETCRRGAERQQCGSLRQAISNCHIIESMQIAAQLQRSMKRCEDVSGLIDQNPMVILGQMNSLIGGEFAQGFFNKFLGGGSQTNG